MRKLLCVVLAVLLSVSSFGGLTAFAGTDASISSADQAVQTYVYTKASGSCGDDLKWVLDSNWTLTISGSGAMPDWGGYIDGVLYQPPWYTSQSKIKEIVISDGVTNIGDKAFQQCYAVESVTIPDSVISIGDYAFWLCESLESIVIPDSVVSIGTYALSGCSSLSSITLGSGVSSIGELAFSYTESLTAISVSESNTCFTDEDGILFDSSLTTLFCYPAKKAGDSYVIPNGIEVIDQGAFLGCEELTSVTIPVSVTQISVYAFSDCDSLASVYYAGTESQWDKINIEKGNDSLLNAMNHFTEFPVNLDDTEVILRNTETYYLHAQINDSYFESYNGDVEGVLDALSFSSDDESIVSVSDEYSYNSVTGEVLFPLEIGTTGSAVIYAEAEDGTETSASVNVVLFLKSGTDTNQFTHSALSWTFTNTDYKDQLWANASSIWDSICLTANYGETAGVCHAISYTMSLGQQGLLDFDSISDGAEYYADLPNPLTNCSFQDILVYYQMLQLTSSGEASQSVDNTQAWYTSSKQNRLSAFLKALVAEAQEGESSETPFLFGFKYNDNESGHTVVVCGYSRDDSGNHEIWIVDPNSYQSGTVLHDYLIMTVASDYSSFSFQDEIRISAGTYLEDVWSRLEFYSIDDIYDDGILVKTAAATAENTDTVDLKISYGKTFCLENDQGEYLAFDGESYTGDMTVYDCSTAGIEGGMYWNLTVSASSSYVLTEADADASFGFTFDGQEYVVSADGADRVSVTANGIEASGEIYNLDVYVETSAVDLVKISAEFEGDASVQYDAESDSIAVTGSSDTDEVSVTYFDGANQATEQADLSAGNLTIDAASGKEMIEETTGGTTDSTAGGATGGTTGSTAGGTTGGTTDSTAGGATGGITDSSGDASRQKSPQKLTIKKSALKKTIKYKKLKKKNQTFKLKATSSGNGKITYKKTSGDKKIKVSKTGKVTVKKGLKKGKTYKVKVKITAANTSTYKETTKTVTLKIKIK